MSHAWNAWKDKNANSEAPPTSAGGGMVSYGGRVDRVRLAFSHEQSIMASIYTRLAIDVASMDILHIRTDDDGRYQETMKSSLNECLTLEPNLDQDARQFKQDIALTMFDSGIAAIVPVDTTLNPATSGSWEVKTLRVGEVVAWYPKYVRVRLYNESTGMRQEITLEKNMVAIVENPFFAVMNEQQSTLRRLIRKLNLLDVVDEQSSSGKLDIIIQLPYTIKSEARRQQAEQRRTDIEVQLKGSQYGIAYADATEKITQLNRPAENNLLAQVQFLTQMLYSQLGMTEEVMNGTADEATMLNYHNRTVIPIVEAIVLAMRRKFLTKTARSQGQSIDHFRNPLKFVPIGQIAELADKFRRGEIATPNDFRVAIGWRPSTEPNADKLQNSNMPAPSTAPSGPTQPNTQQGIGGNSQNGS